MLLFILPKSLKRFVPSADVAVVVVVAVAIVGVAVATVVVAADAAVVVADVAVAAFFTRSHSGFILHINLNYVLQKFLAASENLRRRDFPAKKLCFTGKNPVHGFLPCFPWCGGCSTGLPT